MTGYQIKDMASSSCRHELKRTFVVKEKRGKVTLKIFKMVCANEICKKIFTEEVFRDNKYPIRCGDATVSDGR